MNGGSAGFSVPADGRGATAGVIPFDGVLALENIDVVNMPTGLSFPKALWTPDLRAQLVLGEFGATDWRAENVACTVAQERWEHQGGFTLAPPPMHHADIAEAKLAALLEKRDTGRNGARMAEIAWQADRPADYWTTLLSIDAGNKPATMAVIASAFAVGQMVGMYFKDFFARNRPAHLLPTLMTVVPTPNHPSYPSNHALQNELVALLLVRLLPDSLKHCYGDAINSLAFRLAEDREVGGLHFSQDTDAGRRIARWLDKTYMRNLNSMQGLLAEARSEWHVTGHTPLHHLPFLNGFTPDNSFRGSTITPITEDPQ
jgi:hypothetical protein